MSSGLIFPRINGPNVAFIFLRGFRKIPIVATFVTFVVSLLSGVVIVQDKKTINKVGASSFPKWKIHPVFNFLGVVTFGGVGTMGTLR